MNRPHRRVYSCRRVSGKLYSSLKTLYYHKALIDCSHKQCASVIEDGEGLASLPNNNTIMCPLLDLQGPTSLASSNHHKHDQ
ncbi:hypothetical protein Acife_1800 [Acidithiobacillus ferrivorans SS3]|uniref:Uncharacterized protein n=1 Tax=Acidithiobacillus ferrivorans SS3 TaxID=743299 RepID=G0JU77_9PROT|nr:hypothetical protein Acife_1800 [Acidithiobacillus ferrivorans SS3]